MTGHGRLDLLAIGNALVDIFCFTDEELAPSFSLHSNNTVHVSPERLDEILPALPQAIFVSGGSAANAAKAAASLGLACAFAGCTGTIEQEKDNWAFQFEHDLHDYGVTCYLESRKGTTGRCLVIRMPGSLTSTACAPSAASLFRTDQIPEILIMATRIVLLDGQVLKHNDLTERLIKLCAQHRVPLAIDVSTTVIAAEYAGTILEALHRADCILFANEEEYLVLANRWGRDPEAFMHPPGEGDFPATYLAALTASPGSYPCIVRKRGAVGADAWRNGQHFSAPTELVNVLDDTAAGDVFAGAFLSAELSGMDTESALHFANKAAASALSVPGSRLDKNEFTELARLLHRNEQTVKKS